MYWLGIDVGTGGTRALLINDQGKVQHAFTAPHEEMRMERPLWAEQRPENWWEAAQGAICGVLAAAGASGKQIRGIGLSGQMHGLVLLDADNEIIRPALIWCDQRSQPQVDAINRAMGREQVLDAIANPVLTGFTLPKLLWVRDHEPVHFERARKMLLPKDYVRFRLTGEFATDVSDASGTALFDVVHRRWSREMAEHLDIDAAILPLALESHCLSGKVSRDAAAVTGLEAGTPVVAGAGDQAASAIGNGIVEPGMVSCTIGTSGVVFAHMEQPAYDSPGRIHTFCHAVAGAWHVMGVTQGAGLSLQWFRNQLAAGSTYDDLTNQAVKAPAGSDGLFWLPYLMGERTPHLDARARGGWVGLTARHTRAELIRSLLEGVAYSQKDCLEIIQKVGAQVQLIRLSGGGARSAVWRQILANVFGKTVAVPETQEGSAYGAALLALAGTCNTAVREVSKAAVQDLESITPQQPEAELYAAAYRIYQSLYPALQDFYRAV